MLRNASELFYDIPAKIKDDQKHAISHLESDNVNELIKYLHENEIGKDQSFLGPFGWRKIVYCDWSASGRGLTFINDYLTKEVLPWYANTHSMANTTATQISMFREEARQIVRHTVNANSDKDSVLFHGNGTTGVVSLLRHIITSQLNSQDILQLNSQNNPQPGKQRNNLNAIFIVGEETHHSLYTPWCDITDNVLLLPDTLGREAELKLILSEIRSADKSVQIFGCFAAVSNVTGKVYDVDKLAQIVHAYDGFIVLDYATGAPYVDINMNPITPGAHKDVIVFSPHKFLGGVESPGVLVIKKVLFRNPKPMVSGGGTVFYVKEDETRYFKAPELREEGGTPNILGSVRAALACYVKLNVGVSTIDSINQKIVQKVRIAFSQSPNIILLDDLKYPKIPLFSFLLKHNDLYLHHNFVVTLLNDLFGIQTRGGCLCAGPYVQRLLGLDSDLNNAYLALLSEDPALDRHHLRRRKEYSSHEIFRPGVVRLSVSYTSPAEVVDFVVAAVEMVAEHGWKLLPFYRCNHETGEWHHLNNLQFNNRRWLSHLKLEGGGVRSKSFPEQESLDRKECLVKAAELFAGISKYSSMQDISVVFEDANNLRWFLLPADVVGQVNHSRSPHAKAPFVPGGLPSDSSVRHLEKLKTILVHNKSLALDSPPVVSDPANLNLSPSTFKRQTFSSSYPTGWTSVLIYAISLLNSLISWPLDMVLKGILRATQGSVTSASDPMQNISEKTSVDGSFDNHHTTIDIAEPEFSLKTEVNEVDKICDPVIKTTGPGPCPVVNNATKEPIIAKWHHPTKTILTPMIKAIEEFEMITSGDKVLLCLSGGKDSLSLLHALRQFQFIAKKKGIAFELGAVTVDPMTPTYNPAPLIPYLSELGVPYFYEKQRILKQAEEMEEVTSICSLCSRMKRGRIYSAARANGYNVVAMGQHLDDLAESFFMSIFHNGLLRTMKANYKVTEGDLRVIRPLIYVRERDLRTFAESRHLPVIPENCPACFEEPKERHRVKQLLAQQELLFPRLANSLQRAMKPLYSKNRVGLESRPMDSGDVQINGVVCKDDSCNDKDGNSEPCNDGDGDMGNDGDGDMGDDGNSEPCSDGDCVMGNDGNNSERNNCNDVICNDGENSISNDADGSVSSEIEDDDVDGTFDDVINENVESKCEEENDLFLDGC